MAPFADRRVDSSAAPPHQFPCACEPEQRGILLTPEHFKIPPHRCFTPSEFAHYLQVDARSIVRLIEDGSLGALPLGHGRYKISYIEIVHFFMRMQGMMN